MKKAEIYINSNMKDIEKYLPTDHQTLIDEASAMTKKMGMKQTDAIMALRNVMSEIEFLNADSNMGWNADIRKANKAIDLVDGSMAQLLMKYNRATV